MFELKDSVGRQLFETISITLVCDDCLKTEHPGARQYHLVVLLQEGY